MSKASRIFRFALQHWFKTLCCLFLFYMVFLSEHSVLRIMRLHTQEAQLQREIEQYQDSVKSFDGRIKQVEVDSKALERHARERLHMHRENEDLYLFEE